MVPVNWNVIVQLILKVNSVTLHPIHSTLKKQQHFKLKAVHRLIEFNCFMLSLHAKESDECTA